MDIKAIQERISELKKQGHTLWEKAEKETKAMSREEKDQYMAKVREDDVLIRADLESAKGQLASARAYQDEEKDEIVRHAGKETKAAPAGRNEFNSLGQLLQAVACAGSNVIAGTFNPSYREELAHKLTMYQAAASGMSTGVPSDGGYMIRKEFTNEFLTKAKSQSVLLPMCRRIPIGPDADSLEYPYIDESSRVDGSRWGGVQVFWRAEAATVAAKQPKIGKGELRLEDIMGLAYATERLLRDAPALEAVLTSAFEDEFGFKIDDSVMRGTGSGQMLGFLNSPALISITRDADDLITITNMLARIPSGLKGGMVWLHHADWLPKLIRLKIGDTPVFIPPGGLPNAPGGMLLGKPLYELEQCSAVGTAGDLILANMGQYVYIEKDNEGMRFDQSMHVRFLYDEMAFRWVYRINGQPIVRTALTPFKGSNTLSPWVTVAA